MMTLDSILEEIRKNLGEARLKQIAEISDLGSEVSGTSAAPAGQPKSTPATKSTFRSRLRAFGTGVVQGITGNNRANVGDARDRGALSVTNRIAQQHRRGERSSMTADELADQEYGANMRAVAARKAGEARATETNRRADALEKSNPTATNAGRVAGEIGGMAAGVAGAAPAAAARVGAAVVRNSSVVAGTQAVKNFGNNFVKGATGSTRNVTRNLDGSKQWASPGRASKAGEAVGKAAANPAAQGAATGAIAAATGVAANKAVNTTPTKPAADVGDSPREKAAVSHQQAAQKAVIDKRSDQDDSEHRASQSTMPSDPPLPPSRPAAAPDAQKPAAPRPVARPKPEAPTQTSSPEPKSKQMFQAYSDKGDDASSADFFRADRQMQKERGLRESYNRVLKNPSVEDTINFLLSEQLNEVRIEKEKPKSQFGAKHHPSKNTHKRTLGALEKRNWGGNQKRKPSTYAEEATKKAFKKLSEKESVRPLGRTATGQAGDVIDTKPTKSELTGYH
jgi:hypothetical protein